MTINPLSWSSCFTGIGGFERHAPSAPTVMVEWDPSCQMVLKRHFPHVTLKGDIADVHGSEMGRPDVMVAGFPCTDLSIGKGHRLGLAGPNSHRFFEFTRLVGEVQRLVDYANPRWVVVENTPGLFTSNRGRDMGTVLRALVELGYGVSWRIVDAAGLGTPQQRRRVLLVGHRGGDARPAWEVLDDSGAGGQDAAQGHRGRSEPGPGPRPIVAGGDLVRVWRKGANSQVNISHGYAGGYRETWLNDGSANTLAGHDGGPATRQRHLILQGGRLRAPTFTEWERLQGFPDGWTDGVRESDRKKNGVLVEAGRFTILGNAIHTGTAGWLWDRLTLVHNSLPQLDATSVGI